MCRIEKSILGYLVIDLVKNVNSFVSSEVNTNGKTPIKELVIIYPTKMINNNKTFFFTFILPFSSSS